jgi:hypothetical protein
MSLPLTPDHLLHHLIIHHWHTRRRVSDIQPLAEHKISGRGDLFLSDKESLETILICHETCQDRGNDSIEDDESKMESNTDLGPHEGEERGDQLGEDEVAPDEIEEREKDLEEEFESGRSQLSVGSIDKDTFDC